MPRRAGLLAPLAAILLGACGEKAGDDTGWWLHDAPNITGQYQFFLEGVSTSNLCEEQTHYVTDWMPGALSISGDTAHELEFRFSDGVSFVGSVDASSSWWFAGSETYDGASLLVSALGTFFADDAQRAISGSIEVDELTSNNCLIEVRISGTRISS